MTLTEAAIIGALLLFALVVKEIDVVKEYLHESGAIIRHEAPCDRIDHMWQQQVNFMRLLQEKRGFPQFPTDLASKKGQQFLKDIRNHLMEELFEAGQHLKNAKSHRATELPEVDREAYKEELVDALHLFFELVIASGITKEELVEAYLKKGEVNEQRILSGY